MCLFDHKHKEDDETKEIKLLAAILKELKEIHVALIDDVVAAVAANTSAVASVVAEIQTLEAQIGNAVDPTVLQGVLTQVNANTAALNAAVPAPVAPTAPVAAPVYGKGQ
jgi:hypothetical protein